MIVGGLFADGISGMDSATYINEYISNCNVEPYPSKVYASAAANGIVCGGWIFDKIDGRFGEAVGERDKFLVLHRSRIIP